MQTEERSSSFVEVFWLVSRENFVGE